MWIVVLLCLSGDPCANFGHEKAFTPHYPTKAACLIDAKKGARAMHHDLGGEWGYRCDKLKPYEPKLLDK